MFEPFGGLTLGSVSCVMVLVWGSGSRRIGSVLGLGLAGGETSVPLTIALFFRWYCMEVERKPLRECRKPRVEVDDFFRVDAKAEGDRIVIGGWESLNGKKTPSLGASSMLGVMLFSNATTPLGPSLGAN